MLADVDLRRCGSDLDALTAVHALIGGPDRESRCGERSELRVLLTAANLGPTSAAVAGVEQGTEDDLDVLPG